MICLVKKLYSSISQKEQEMIAFTKHGMRRMNQRGITKEMIELTIEYGHYHKDKVILKSRDIKKLLTKVSSHIKSRLMKLLDKGGLVVVLSDDITVITAYHR